MKLSKLFKEGSFYMALCFSIIIFPVDNPSIFDVIGILLIIAHFAIALNNIDN
jgi:hypothetical protein